MQLAARQTAASSTDEGVGVARGLRGFGAKGHPRSTWNLGQSMLAALRGCLGLVSTAHKPEPLVLSHRRCIRHPELETVLRGALGLRGCSTRKLTSDAADDELPRYETVKG